MLLFLMSILVQLQKKLKIISNLQINRNKSFQDFLHPDEESLFAATNDAHKVNLIISALFSNKSTDPNSLPTKILKPLKNGTSTHLADIVCLYIS